MLTGSRESEQEKSGRRGLARTLEGRARGLLVFREGLGTGDDVGDVRVLVERGSGAFTPFGFPQRFLFCFFPLLFPSFLLLLALQERRSPRLCQIFLRIDQGGL